MKTAKCKMQNEQGVNVPLCRVSNLPFSFFIFHFALIFLAFLTAPTSPARGDVFALVNGGRVEGELLNPDEKPRKRFEVQLPTGGKVILDAAQVEEHTAVRPDEQQYEQVRPSFPDTAEGQWALSEWCREHRLGEERTKHLQRVVELAPEHVQARLALGYTKIDGRWTRRDEEMRNRGLFPYKGQWLTEQEIKLMEAKREQELLEKDWFQKVNRWRGWLANGSDAGATSLRSIDDPAAVKALVHIMRTDRDASVRVFFAELLAKFPTGEAVKALAASALEDSHEEVRESCLDCLAKRPSPDAVTYFCSPSGLKSKDNVMVNRAGVALGKLRDPSAIAPLIDALVTTHKYKVSGNPNQYNVGFGSGGPGGFSFGNSTKIVSEAKANQSVLDALAAMTGQNFGFNQREWRNWFAMQKKRETIDARRD